MSEGLIQLRDLCIATPERKLIEGVSADIYSEKVTALCGPSGSGKSLTARAMMGVLDVMPGIQKGSLIYPKLDPQKTRVRFRSDMNDMSKMQCQKAQPI